MRLLWTDAGYAALVNATNNGTAPVLCAQIAVGSGTTAATASDTALETETKRLATISGQAVAPNIIHVVYRDESADSYPVNEIGLIADDGTLLARYAQSAIIVEKAAASTALLEIDATLTGVDTANIAFPSLDFVNPPWSETVQGVLEKATDAEATAGTDNSRGMTAKLVFAAIKAFFGGATGAGAGKGLDADTLDGVQGAGFAKVVGSAQQKFYAAAAETVSQVINLGQADGRYGRLAKANSWAGENTFPAGAEVANGVALSGTADDPNNWPPGYSVTWAGKQNALSNGYSSVVTFRQPNNAGDTLQLIYDWADISGNPISTIRYRTHVDNGSWSAVKQLATTADISAQHTSDVAEFQPAGSYATAAQGAEADSAVQPTDRANSALNMQSIGTGSDVAHSNGLYTLPGTPGHFATNSADITGGGAHIDINGNGIEWGGYGSYTTIKFSTSYAVGTYHQIWTEVNQGSGSGMDADLLDGQQGSFYAPANLFSGVNVVTSSRALGSTYTNSTGKPMLVSVSTYTTSSTGSAGYINGTIVARQGINSHSETGDYGLLTMIVPAGSTYKVTGSSLTYWTETY
ncbi:MAG: hypothetical protein PF501_19100 [Salinisphaera sp.]|jgi:hypothetical protein|nr:hypothetical protein [Salinisphaera sp.]